MHLLTVAGHQLMAWSVGIAATTVLLDQGPGFTRDHPPAERRATGALTGPLAVLSLLALLTDLPDYTPLLIAAPYTLMAVSYSLSWIQRRGAKHRRRIGWQTGIIGVVGLLVLMLTAGPELWHGGVVIATYSGSAALLGGLTCLMVKSIYGIHPGDVEDPTSPYGIPARCVAFGMGIAGLAALDGLAWAFTGHSGWVPFMLCWLCFSLVIPGALTGLGHKLYPRLQPYIWASALLSAIGGQAAIHAVTLFFPGLIPPAVL